MFDENRDVLPFLEKAWVSTYSYILRLPYGWYIGLKLIFPEDKISSTKGKDPAVNSESFSIKKSPSYRTNTEGVYSLGLVQKPERHKWVHWRGHSWVRWELSLHDCLSLSNAWFYHQPILGHNSMLKWNSLSLSLYSIQILHTFTYLIRTRLKGNYHIFQITKHTWFKLF